MKFRSIVAALVGGVVVFGGFAVYAGPVGKRQLHQRNRIQQGIHSGTLTPAETRHLVREQRAIERAKRKAWADGKLTPAERTRLQILQDKASGDIYRLKHNKATVPDAASL